MKTDDLIDLMAQGAGPAPRHPALPRLALALGLGVLTALAVVLMLMKPVSGAVLAQGAWWVKLGYAVALAATLAWLAARLGRPVVRAQPAVRWVAAVVAVMVALAAWQTLAAAPEVRMALWRGHSASTCPLSVLALSLPTLALGLWALRGLAPTRLRWAGAAVGLMAGATGAAAYAVACDELGFSFVATWYTLGIALAGALGTWLGPRTLRW
jgi:hypothetical protein